MPFSAYSQLHTAVVGSACCTMYSVLYMATIYGALPQFTWDEQVSDCTNQVHTATHMDLPHCSIPKLGLTMLGRVTITTA